MSESCETNKLISDQVPDFSNKTGEKPELTRRDVITRIAADALVFAFGSSIVMRLFGGEAYAAPIKLPPCFIRPPRPCGPRPIDIPRCPSSPSFTPRPFSCGLTPNVCLATHGCGLTPNVCLATHGCGLKLFCSTTHDCGIRHYLKSLDGEDKSPDIVKPKTEEQESGNEERKQKSKEMLRSAVREILKRLETEFLEGDK
jgi:hypothetical protein